MGYDTPSKTHFLDSHFSFSFSGAVLQVPRGSLWVRGSILTLIIYCSVYYTKQSLILEQSMFHTKLSTSEQSRSMTSWNIFVPDNISITYLYQSTADKLLHDHIWLINDVDMHQQRRWNSTLMHILRVNRPMKSRSYFACTSSCGVRWG